MQRVVVDADTGVDDMVALWYLSRQPDVSVEAVTACHGNVPAAQAAGNALKVLQTLGRPDVPVALGSEDPIERALGVETQVHGDDGLGGVGAAPVSSGQLPDAVEVLLDLSRRHEGEIDLLALGSLTNLGHLAQADPLALQRFRSIVFLGTVGGTCQPQASHVVDANVAYDVGAARYLQQVPGVVYCPVDVTATVMFERDDLARIDALDSPMGHLAADALKVYIDFHQAHTMRRAIRMHDPTAAVALVRPSVRAVTRAGVLDVIETPCREGRRGVVVRSSPSDKQVEGTTSAGHQAAVVVSALDVPAVKAELHAAFEAEG
jgi:purine nucleosidase